MLKKFDQILNKKSSASYTKSPIAKETATLFDFLELMKNWKKVVGDMLGANSIPLKINQGTLTIITKHSAISNELNFMGPAIKANITKAYPELKHLIDKIYFQNSPVIFDQMKQDEQKFVERKIKEKHLNHPFSPEYIARVSEAKEFYGETLIQDENPLDPEMQELLLSLKIQKDRANPGKP